MECIQSETDARDGEQVRDIVGQEKQERLVDVDVVCGCKYYLCCRCIGRTVKNVSARIMIWRREAHVRSAEVIMLSVEFVARSSIALARERFRLSDTSNMAFQRVCWRKSESSCF